MKHLMFLTFGICLLLTSVPAMADQADDEAAIRTVIEALISTMNDGDAKSMMAYVDPVYESPDGSSVDNKVITESYARLEHSNPVLTINMDHFFHPAQIHDDSSISTGYCIATKMRFP